MTDRSARSALADANQQQHAELARLRARVTELETERDALLAALPEQRRQT